MAWLTAIRHSSRGTARAWTAVVLAACCAPGCRDGSAARGRADGEASSAREAGPADDPAHTRLLAAPPLVGRATRHGAVLAVMAGAEPVQLELHVAGRDAPDARARLAAGETARLSLAGLPGGATTEYVLTVRADENETRDASATRVGADPEQRASAAPPVEHLAGRVTTARPPGTSFTFAAVSDSHLPAPPPEWLLPDAERHPWEAASFDEGRAYAAGVLAQVMDSVRGARPDFIVHLGDMLDGHMLGDNAPFPTVDVARAAYHDLRVLLGGAGAEAAFYAVIGNWDGENGWHPPALVANARRARGELVPNPDATTYPEAGGEHGDYYAFTWGDALIVALNVMSYTRTSHGIEGATGRADDWTLGDAQLAWFARTLAASDARHKIVLVHHVVGGAGANDDESSYGRGGGRAAHVGEQATVHALMREHGARLLLYGHDHVFTSMVVDDIAYVLPGSAGAPWKFGADVTGYEHWDERSGFALVDVSPEALAVRFCDVRGEVFETLTVAGDG